MCVETSAVVGPLRLIVGGRPDFAASLTHASAVLGPYFPSGTTIIPRDLRIFCSRDTGTVEVSVP